ncbi:MAG: DUF6048 family protein [Bacteroidales bacterium]
MLILRQIKIFRFSFSLCLLLLLPAFLKGQTDTSRFYLRTGIDIGRFVTLGLNPGNRGLEFSLDSKISKDIHLVAEFGLNNYTQEEDFVDYHANGYFVRAGLNYNMLDNEKFRNNDIVFLGIRPAWCSFTHSANDVIIRDSHWGNTRTQIAEQDLNVFWLEALAGIKVEVLQNLYLGWSIRGKVVIAVNGDDDSNPAYIPGFGKSVNKSVIGINYNVAYMFML